MKMDMMVCAFYTLAKKHLHEMPPGGLRLLQATFKKFHSLLFETPNYCYVLPSQSEDEEGKVMKKQKRDARPLGFSLSYRTTIPRCSGLAGSSAIVTACFKCLLRHYRVEIDQDLLSKFTLSVEAEELKISAGLQDRVIQARDRLTFMNFTPHEFAKRQGLYGNYESVLLGEEERRRMFQLFYLAFSKRASKGGKTSGKVHNDVKWRRLRTFITN